jgi:hypothetical protein
MNLSLLATCSLIRLLERGTYEKKRKNERKDKKESTMVGLLTIISEQHTHSLKIYILFVFTSGSFISFSSDAHIRGKSAVMRAKGAIALIVITSFSSSTET